MLLMATFSAQRWRSWPRHADDTGFVDWQPGGQDSPPASLGYPHPDPPFHSTQPGAWPPQPRAGAGWDDPTR
jgi:hypothetical protein